MTNTICTKEYSYFGFTYSFTYFWGKAYFGLAECVGV